MAPQRKERPHGMADYGVPDNDEGLLEWSWAEERLLGSRNFWIATTTPTGAPHVMPVWGAWVPADDAYWFSCANEAKKARNLRANPAIAVTVQDTVEVVVIEGTAEEVDPAEAEMGIAAIGEKYRDEPGMDEPGQLEDFLRDTAVWKVTPKKAFGIIERPEDFGPRATKWTW